MVEWFKGLEPLTQAILATCFTWGMTALGASAVFFFKEMNRKMLDAMLGFAGGVMIAASYWSLLAPAIEMSEAMGAAPWFPPAVGFMLGAAVLFMMDKILPHLHIGYPRETAEGMETTWHRTTLVVMAITLHNAPEGLAVGVAFGALGAGADLPSATLVGACDRDRNSEFPGRVRRSNAVKARGSVAVQEFLVRTAFGSGRTYRSGYRCAHRYPVTGDLAVRPRLCRRRDDLCCCGRGDS